MGVETNNKKLNNKDKIRSSNSVVMPPESSTTSSRTSWDILRKNVKNIRFLDKAGKFSLKEANSFFYNQNNSVLNQEAIDGKTAQNILRFFLAPLSFLFIAKDFIAKIKAISAKKTIWQKIIENQKYKDLFKNALKLNKDKEKEVKNLVTNILYKIYQKKYHEFDILSQKKWAELKKNANEIEKWQHRVLLQLRQQQIKQTILQWEQEVLQEVLNKTKKSDQTKNIWENLKLSPWKQRLLLQKCGLRSHYGILEITSDEKQMLEYEINKLRKKITPTKKHSSYNKQTTLKNSGQKNKHAKNLSSWINLCTKTITALTRYFSAFIGAVGFTIFFPFAPHIASTVYYSCSTIKNSSRSTGETINFFYHLWKSINLKRQIEDYGLMLEIAKKKKDSTEKQPEKDNQNTNIDNTIHALKYILKAKKKKQAKRANLIRNHFKTGLLYLCFLVGVAFIYFATATLLINIGLLLISTGLLFNSAMDTGININKIISYNKQLKNKSITLADIKKIKQARSKAIYKACTNCSIAAFYAIGFLAACTLFVPIPPVQMVGAFITYGVMAINAVLFPTFYCVEKAVYPKEKKKLTKKDKINIAINTSVITSSTVLFSLGTIALFIPEPVVSKVLCGVFIGLGASLMLGLTGAKLISKLVSKYKLKKKLAQKTQAIKETTRNTDKTLSKKTNNTPPKKENTQPINNQEKKPATPITKNIDFFKQNPQTKNISPRHDTNRPNHSLIKT